ncbi:MAG: glycosylase, partial [Halobacteriovoraceae bacterium]|nr:glycosylase [Halobacteriovoraceae bacterium]
SKDGINWTKINKDIIPSKLGEEEAQACPDTIFANGKYHMFFCYRRSVDFRRNKEGSYRIGYATSTDMVNWERNDSKIGIDISEEGWDSEMVAYPTVFELDGKTYMLYLGNEVGRYGFGLAELEGELI